MRRLLINKSFQFMILSQILIVLLFISPLILVALRLHLPFLCTFLVSSVLPVPLGGAETSFSFCPVGTLKKTHLCICSMYK